MLIRSKILLLIVLTILSISVVQAKTKCLTAKNNKANIAACTSLADKGDANAQNTLGEIYYKEALKNKSYHTKARLLFEKAAKQGLAKAQYNLGSMYRDEFNNFPIALSWFEKAAAQGNLDAQNSIGYIYENASGGQPPRHYYFDENGENIDPELPDLIAKFVTNESSLPSSIYPRAIYPISDYGQGVNPDINKAIEWYKMAAIQGHPLAQTNLAYFYLIGFGVDKDVKVAFELYQSAAKQNCIPAIKTLAFMYFQGIATKVDVPKGFKMLEKAYRLSPDNELWKVITNIQYNNKYKKYGLKTNLKFKKLPQREPFEYSNSSNEDFIYERLIYFKSFYQLNMIEDDAMKSLYIRNRKTNSRILGETIGEITPLRKRFLLKKAIQGYYSAMTLLSRYYKDEELNINIAQLWRKYATRMGEVTYKNFWPGYPELDD